MLQLCLRLLSSRLAAGSIVDELIVTEKMKKQASLQKDSRASLQLQDCLGRLKQKHVLTRRLQVLCVLANLSFSPDASSSSYVTWPFRPARVSLFADTSRLRFLRRPLPRNAWKSAFLLLSLCRRRLLPDHTKTPPQTPSLKLHSCAIACLSCTASMARLSFARIQRRPQFHFAHSTHCTHMQFRSSNLRTNPQARVKSTSRRLCPLLFVA